MIPWLRRSIYVRALGRTAVVMVLLTITAAAALFFTSLTMAVLPLILSYVVGLLGEGWAAMLAAFLIVSVSAYGACLTDLRKEQKRNAAL